MTALTFSMSCRLSLEENGGHLGKHSAPIYRESHCISQYHVNHKQWQIIFLGGTKISRISGMNFYGPVKRK